jgi:hypothetical protein
MYLEKVLLDNSDCGVGFLESDLIFHSTCQSINFYTTEHQLKTAISHSEIKNSEVLPQLADLNGRYL